VFGSLQTLIVHKQVIRLCLFTFTLFLSKVGQESPAESTTGRSEGMTYNAEPGLSAGQKLKENHHDNFMVYPE